MWPGPRDHAGLLVLAPLAVAVACDTAPATPEPSPPWPEAPRCQEVQAWPTEWVERETQALEHLADLRERGADCGERGKFGPAPALTRVLALDCAARIHARDMIDREFFGRLDPDGVDELARAEQAGYRAATLVQHIAAGPVDGEQLIDLTWGPRPVPCESLVSATLTEVGFAYAQAPATEDEGEPRPHWVIVLASPE